MSDLWPYVAALLPTAGLLYLFYVVMRHILEGDRRERAAQAAWEARHESGHGLPEVTPQPPSNDR